MAVRERAESLDSTAVVVIENAADEMDKERAQDLRGGEGRSVSPSGPIRFAELVGSQITVNGT